MSRVAGNIPTFTSPSHSSVPVSYLWIEPNGLPWAIETYQWRPPAEMLMPWGPSISAGKLPTVIVFVTSMPEGPNRIRDTSSSDSAQT